MEAKEFFDEKYHKDYNIGAIEVKVGTINENEISLLDKVVDSIFIKETNVNGVELSQDKLRK